MSFNIQNGYQAGKQEGIGSREKPNTPEIWGIWHASVKLFYAFPEELAEGLRLSRW